MKRKALASLLLLWLAVSTLGSLQLIRSTKANPTPNPERLATKQCYIRSNGTVDPPALPIQREGNVYRLTDNIINCTFEIESDNVIFDGNGFLLSVPAYGEVDKNGRTKGAYALISISNKSNIIVKNVTFAKYSTAIDIRNSSDIIIFQNNMRNGTTGIYMLRSANTSIIGNQIIENHRGMLIQDSTSLTISYNTVSENQYCGIEVDHLTRSIFNGIQRTNISRNDFTDNGYAGLYFLGLASNNRIFENNFINNDVGLSFYGELSSNNSVFNNYWSNYRLQIDAFAADATSGVDSFPFSRPISTSFDPSLFPLPSLTPDVSPAPDSQSDAEPFPIVPVAAASVASISVIAVGLLVYFKKRKH